MTERPVLDKHLDSKTFRDFFADNKGKSLEEAMVGDKQSFTFGSRKLQWRVLSLSEPLPLVFQPTEVGNALGSKTNDVLYVEATGENSPYLLIDLGETTFQGESGYRMYSRILVE